MIIKRSPLSLEQSRSLVHFYRLGLDRHFPFYCCSFVLFYFYLFVSLFGGGFSLFNHLDSQAQLWAYKLCHTIKLYCGIMQQNWSTWLCHLTCEENCSTPFTSLGLCFAWVQQNLEEILIYIKCILCLKPRAQDVHIHVKFKITILGWLIWKEEEHFQKNRTNTD